MKPMEFKTTHVKCITNVAVLFEADMWELNQV